MQFECPFNLCIVRTGDQSHLHTVLFQQVQKFQGAGHGGQGHRAFVFGRFFDDHLTKFFRTVGKILFHDVGECCAFDNSSEVVDTCPVTFTCLIPENIVNGFSVDYHAVKVKESRFKFHKNTFIDYILHTKIRLFFEKDSICCKIATLLLCIYE